jgi:hypothetical protein
MDRGHRLANLRGCSDRALPRSRLTRLPASAIGGDARRPKSSSTTVASTPSQQPSQTSVLWWQSDGTGRTEPAQPEVGPLPAIVEMSRRVAKHVNVGPLRLKIHRPGFLTDVVSGPQYSQSNPHIIPNGGVGKQHTDVRVVNGGWISDAPQASGGGVLELRTTGTISVCAPDCGITIAGRGVTPGGAGGTSRMAAAGSGQGSGSGPRRFS